MPIASAPLRMAKPIRRGSNTCPIGCSTRRNIILAARRRSVCLIAMGECLHPSFLVTLSLRDEVNCTFPKALSP